MSKKDVKELAKLTISQCKERLVSFIKSLGLIDNLSIPIIKVDKNKNIETLHIYKIDDGMVYYTQKKDYCECVTELRVEELYYIIKNL